MDHGRADLADGLPPLWVSAPAQRTRSVLLVPSRKDPRLVLPAGGGRASAAVLHALRDETSTRARAKSLVLRAAATLHVRTTELPDPPLLDVVARHLAPPVAHADLVYGVHLGPPRANRKPVLALATDDGELVAIVKWGMSDLSDRLVRREADALRELADLPGELVTVPRLLGEGEFGGHPYVVQSPVPTSGAGRWSAERTAAAQVAVATSGGAAAGEAYLERLEGDSLRRPRSADAPDRAAAELLAGLTRSWVRRARTAKLPCGRWHGDWRRTNMALTKGECVVWDWERFDSGVPLGYDALHLHLTTIAGSTADLDTLPDQVLQAAPNLLRPFGVRGRDDAELVACGYFLELAGRYLDDGQSRSGARLGAVGTWLLPTLADVLGAPAPKQPHDDQGGSAS